MDGVDLRRDEDLIASVPITKLGFVLQFHSLLTEFPALGCVPVPANAGQLTEEDSMALALLGPSV